MHYLMIILILRNCSCDLFDFFYSNMCSFFIQAFIFFWCFFSIYIIYIIIKKARQEFKMSVCDREAVRASTIIFFTSWALFSALMSCLFSSHYSYFVYLKSVRSSFTAVKKNVKWSQLAITFGMFSGPDSHLRTYITKSRLFFSAYHQFCRLWHSAPRQQNSTGRNSS